MSSRNGIRSRLASGALSVNTLTGRQREVLFFISQHAEGVSGNAICRAHGITLQTLGDHTAPLRMLGLIVRCGAGASSVYASAEHAPAVLAKIEDRREAMCRRKNASREARRRRAADAERARLLAGCQTRISAAEAKLLPKLGPASVFDMGAFA